MSVLRQLIVAAAATAVMACDGGRQAQADRLDGDWPVYGGGASSDRYSPLRQIDRSNVAALRVAWRFDMAETGDPQTNPLIVGRQLFAYTPDLKVIALEAATGKPIWTFDSGIHGSGPSRGLTYWTDGREHRVYAGVMNVLFALDSATGKPITTFGDGGRIDLRKGLAQDYSKFYVSLTSPAVLYKDLLIVGFRTAETKPAAPGDIRAFDVRTGALRWTFHTIPEAGEPGSETWPAGARQDSGAANNWSGLSLDRERGIVYVPTGSAVNDFYGADRHGQDLYSNSLLALDAATGKRVWHFQVVHHDILDRDLPTAPSLVTLTRDGKRVDVVAQPTKHGYLFLFERQTGKPFFPIGEQAVPTSLVDGEASWPTQPQPELPAPFARQRLTEDLLTTRTPQAHEWAVKQFAELRSEGPFTPAGVDKAAVVFPGFDGGAEWGGAAVDPATGVMYLNSNDVAWTARLAPNMQVYGRGAVLYQNRCSACHGPDRVGSPPAFPSLVDLQKRFSERQTVEVIHAGRGRMPSFADITGTDLSQLLEYLSTGKDVLPGGRDEVAQAAPSSNNAQAKEEALAPMSRFDASAKYVFTGYNKFLDPDGYPAVAPPWGTLNAIDLNTGRYLWRIPFGEYPELVAQGLRDTGSENYGGPIVTASGLLFIGATIYDQKIRAFDSSTGKVLWQSQLPYAGTATPATYMVDGKQYVVILANSARNRRGPQGAAYVAYALP